MIHSKGGDFEDVSLLEARACLGFDEDDLKVINFPNKIQYQDEDKFKKENSAVILMDKAWFLI